MGGIHEVHPHTWGFVGTDLCRARTRPGIQPALGLKSGVGQQHRRRRWPENAPRLRSAWDSKRRGPAGIIKIKASRGEAARRCKTGPKDQQTSEGTGGPPEDRQTRAPADQQKEVPHKQVSVLFSRFVSGSGLARTCKLQLQLLTASMGFQAPDQLGKGRC